MICVENWCPQARTYELEDCYRDFVYMFVYVFVYMFVFMIVCFRGIISGKAGKAAALPKFSVMLTLSQFRGWEGRLFTPTHWLCLT